MSSAADRFPGLPRRTAAFGLTAVGTALLAGCDAPRLPGAGGASATEGQLETTTLRIGKTAAPDGNLCFAPQWLAEPALREAGFDALQYVALPGNEIPQAVAEGILDMNMQQAGMASTLVDAGQPVVILAGVHVGCYELFAGPGIRSLRDLKGKRVAATGPGTGNHVFLAALLAHVGLDVNRDITLIADQSPEAIRRLAAGEIDAFLAFPPWPQEMRATGIGRALLSTHMDRPWSQYFCCVLVANREFLRKYPVAAKRAARAILASADMCAREPERAAQFLLEGGYTTRHDFTLQTMREVPYGRWREYNPEDTVRFYALRLKDVGLIKSTPQQIISRGTDWRFLNELKKEAPAPMPHPVRM